MDIPLWLIPSFYGDIKVTQASKGTCKLVTEKLTPRERQVLKELTPHAVKRNWIDKGQSLIVPEIELRASVTTVSKAVSRRLKPTRKVVSAVKFASGTMEEVTEAVFDDTLKDKPAVATSVAAPVKGCPAPDFVRAELKARAVLEAFLTEEQIEDFRAYNRFVSTGATTGRRYMITSRHACDALARYHRSLYDLDAGMPLCVHDWAVPAAEEMLALHVFLQLPGRESHLRVLE